MKILISYKNKLFTLVMLSFVTMQSALAALPAAGTVTAGSGVTGTTVSFAALRQLLGSGVGLAAVGIPAVVVLGISFAIYTSFSKAQEKGEWKGFATTAIVGVVIIVVVILLAIYAVGIVA